MFVNLDNKQQKGEAKNVRLKRALLLIAVANDSNKKHFYLYIILVMSLMKSK